MIALFCLAVGAGFWIGTFLLLVYAGTFRKDKRNE